MLHKGKCESKNRPFTRRALDPDPTALRFYQALSHGMSSEGEPHGARTRAITVTGISVASFLFISATLSILCESLTVPV